MKDDTKQQLREAMIILVEALVDDEGITPEEAGKLIRAAADVAVEEVVTR